MIVSYLLGRLTGEIRTDQPEELEVSPELVVRDSTCRRVLPQGAPPTVA